MTDCIDGNVCNNKKTNTLENSVILGVLLFILTSFIFGTFIIFSILPINNEIINNIENNVNNYINIKLMILSTSYGVLYLLIFFVIFITTVATIKNVNKNLIVLNSIIMVCIFISYMFWKEYAVKEVDINKLNTNTKLLIKNLKEPLTLKLDGYELKNKKYTYYTYYLKIDKNKKIIIIFDSYIENLISLNDFEEKLITELNTLNTNTTNDLKSKKDTISNVFKDK